ncbi:hypothetical protein F4703DRAFT_1794884 [Phycomyces blakesleeanus]
MVAFNNQQALKRSISLPHRYQRDSTIKLWGTVKTDGVEILILKHIHDTIQESTYRRATIANTEDTFIIGAFSSEQQEIISDHFIFVDSGRYLSYCMCEDFTVAGPRGYWYTSSQQRVEPKRGKFF